MNREDVSGEASSFFVWT